ncbi:hypothetical protein IH979_02730 [Patescibacteria group bacterium]|nr:hypothetical protein [Patescibacteria group bacterium]
MILLHRITSFALALVAAVGFWILTYLPEQTSSAMIGLVVLIPLLLARLLKWDVRRFSFWVFLGTPTFFLLSSLFLFLFLESNLAKVSLGIIVTIGIWLYGENLFSFYHLPSSYQAYALEYLSLVLYVASGFFFTSGAYGTQLVLQLPIWIPALAVFWVVLFATIGVFWVSKIAQETSVLFALSGALLMTELYFVFAMLPTSFLTNAAAFSVFLYLYLGLARAHVLEKLSKKVLRRYVIIGGLLLAIVFGTARWV